MKCAQRKMETTNNGAYQNGVSENELHPIC